MSTRLAEPRWLVISAERLMVSAAQLAVYRAFEVMPRPEEVEVDVEAGLLGNVYVFDRDSVAREIDACCGDPADCQEEGCAGG